MPLTACPTLRLEFSPLIQIDYTLKLKIDDGKKLFSTNLKIHKPVVVGYPLPSILQQVARMGIQPAKRPTQTQQIIVLNTRQWYAPPPQLSNYQVEEGSYLFSFPEFKGEMITPEQQAEKQEMVLQQAGYAPGIAQTTAPSTDYHLHVNQYNFNYDTKTDFYAKGEEEEKEYFF